MIFSVGPQLGSGKNQPTTSRCRNYGGKKFLSLLTTHCGDIDLSDATLSRQIIYYRILNIELFLPQKEI